MAARRSTTGSQWLPLGAASRLLGVDSDTLRRWANSGRVEAFTTPGGHRRFERRSLERLIADRRVDAHPRISSLGASPGRIASAMRRAYAAESRLGQRPRRALRREDRDAFRRQGRLLVEALVARLDGDEPRADRLAESEAIAIVAGFAARLAHAGVGVAEAVTMFVDARQSFLAELAALGRRRRLTADGATALLAEASSLLDRVLLGFLASHQAAVGMAASEARP